MENSKKRKCRLNGRRVKKLAIMLAVVVTITSVSPATTAEASSAKWKKACKAYTTWLAKNQSKFKALEFDFWTKNKENYKKSDRFMIVDLDKNGVPELVTTHPFSYKQDSIYVYTYKSGKVVQVKNSDGKSGKEAEINISCNASGWYEVYRCKNKHLHVIWDGGYEGKDECVYTVSKGKLKLYARGYEVDLIRGSSNSKGSYTINGKKVSAKKYKALIKKCNGKKAEFVLNTKTNRKKYLK